MATKPHRTLIDTIARQLRGDLEYRVDKIRQIETLEDERARAKNEHLALEERIKAAEEWMRKHAPADLKKLHDREAERARAAAFRTN